MLDRQKCKITFDERYAKVRNVASVAGSASQIELVGSIVTLKIVTVGQRFVPEELRVRGWAQVRTDHLVEDARVKDQWIVPLCFFVRADAGKRRKELDDVAQW